MSTQLKMLSKANKLFNNELRCPGVVLLEQRGLCHCTGYASLLSFSFLLGNGTSGRERRKIFLILNPKICFVTWKIFSCVTPTLKKVKKLTKQNSNIK